MRNFDHTKVKVTEALGMEEEYAGKIIKLSENVRKQYEKGEIDLFEVMENSYKSIISINLDIKEDDLKDVPVLNLHAMLFGYGLISGEIISQLKGD